MPSRMQSVAIYIVFHPLYPYFDAFTEALHPAEWFSKFFNIWLAGCTAMTANIRRHAAATQDERWIAALEEVENLLATAEGYRGSNATVFQRMEAGYALATLHSTIRYISREARI